MTLILHMLDDAAHEQRAHEFPAEALRLLADASFSILTL
jgi:hypothetical protein